jgi:hypothetical protein
MYGFLLWFRSHLASLHRWGRCTKEKDLGGMVVEFLFGVAGEAAAEEAFVAGLATIRTSEEQIVTGPLDRANSSRAVGSVATAIRAKGRLLLTAVFGHGDVLARRTL